MKLDDEVQANVGEYSGLKVGWGEIGSVTMRVVMLISAAEGSGMLEGWLWVNIIAAALCFSAVLTISRG